MVNWGKRPTLKKTAKESKRKVKINNTQTEKKVTARENSIVCLNLVNNIVSKAGIYKLCVM